MKKIYLIVLISVFPLKSFSQKLNEEYGAPLIVLTETNPWLMVIGSDVPNFVLYEKGQIIFKKIKKDTIEFKQVILSKEETQNFISNLGLSDALFKLPRYIEASSWTDQPSNDLVLNFDTIKVITVYGRLRSDKSESRAKVPKIFLTVFDKLISYDTSTATPWLPENIELMVWDYSYAPKSKEWPKEWPDLNSSTTIKHSNDMYSIFLDKKYFLDLKKFLRSLEEKQAVEINGKKMTISYRMPFPNLN